MHILLITSEELHPDNLLGSIFEISQAKALREKGVKVSILSIRIFPNLKQWFKTILKTIFVKFKLIEASKMDYTVWQAILFGFKYFKKKEVKLYEIDGIQVFEGIGFPLFLSNRSQIGNLNFWNYVGIRTFNEYVKLNGIPNLVHAHSRFLSAGILAAKIYRTHKIPFVVTEHSSFYKRHIAERPELLAQLKKYIESMFFLSRANCFVSPSLRGLVEELFPNISKTPSYIIPNILNESFNDNFTDIDFDSTSKINICCIGSLDRNKNHILLIKALEEINKTSPLQFNVRIIGNGVLKQELEKEIINRNLYNVQLLGNLKIREVIKVIDASHFLVHPSVYETFGVAIIEALARGRPVISTRSGGPEHIINDQNGILIPNHQKALERAILKMTNDYPNYDLRAIRKSALDSFGSGEVGGQLVELYKKYK